MAADYWWRSWHGAPTDLKWALIAKKAGVKTCEVISLAWALMDFASQNEKRGSINGFDVETFSMYSGIEEESINSIITQMADKGIIVDSKFAKWEKRQPKSESEVSRVQEYRRKKAKDIEESSKPLQDVTECYEPLQDVTKNYTDTDTDTELINMPVAGKVLAEKSMPVQQNNKKEIPKKEYGEFMNVRLTDDELDKLKQLYPINYPEWIEKLSCWKKSKNKKTASDYATIRNWARREAAEKPPEKEEKREKWPLM